MPAGEENAPLLPQSTSAGQYNIGESALQLPVARSLASWKSVRLNQLHRRADMRRTGACVLAEGQEEGQSKTQQSQVSLPAAFHDGHGSFRAITAEDAAAPPASMPESFPAAVRIMLIRNFWMPF